jgi:hypothetical protein
MPSDAHEVPIQLVKEDPELPAWLLRNHFHVDVPEYKFANAYATDARQTRTMHSDGATRYSDHADKASMGAVTEVQLGRDPRKLRTWKTYVALLEEDLDVPVRLVLFIPDPAIASWYWRLLRTDGTSSIPLQPYMFSRGEMPPIVDVDLAWEHPALVMLSAYCNAGEPGIDDMFPAACVAVRSGDEARELAYNDYMLSWLPEAAAARWRDYMTTTAGPRYFSEEFRKADAEGEERGVALGEAHGRAEALLMFLDGHDWQVPGMVRERILSCTDVEQLDTWIRRAATAHSLADVITD